MDNISHHVFNNPVLVLNKGLLPDHDDVSLARYLFSALTLAVSRISQNEEMIVGFHLHPQEITCWGHDDRIRENIIPLNIQLSSDTPIAGFIQNMMAWMTADAIQQENNAGARVLRLGAQHTRQDIFDLELTWQPPVDNAPVRALVCHVVSREGTFMLTLRFNPARFSAAQVRKLPAVWRQITAFAEKNGAETLRDIRLIDDAERQCVLHTFNQTDQAWDG
ncbi:amino acid adenylation protein, partial [Dickeya dianthicola]|nr:amino acid adenylation protein [Dickeya dianthicola]